MTAIARRPLFADVWLYMYMFIKFKEKIPVLLFYNSFNVNAYFDGSDDDVLSVFEIFFAYH